MTLPCFSWAAGFIDRDADEVSGLFPPAPPRTSMTLPDRSWLAGLKGPSDADVEATAMGLVPLAPWFTGDGIDLVLPNPLVTGGLGWAFPENTFFIHFVFAYFDCFLWKIGFSFPERKQAATVQL